MKIMPFVFKHMITLVVFGSLAIIAMMILWSFTTLDVYLIIALVVILAWWLIWARLVDEADANKKEMENKLRSQGIIK